MEPLDVVEGAAAEPPLPPITPIGSSHIGLHRGQAPRRHQRRHRDGALVTEEEEKDLHRPEEREDHEVFLHECCCCKQIVATTVTTPHVDDPVNLVQDHVVYLGCANVGDEDDAAGSGKAMPLLLLPTSTS